MRHSKKMKMQFGIPVLLSIAMATTLSAQQQVGINTISPDRILEVRGVGDQFVRIHTLSAFGADAGLELVRGQGANSARDWSLVNDGSLRILTGTDDFVTSGTEVWRIDNQGYVGLGTTSAASRLHIVGGEQATNTDDGHILLGNKANLSLAADFNSITARNNGAASPLFFQEDGGNTYISYSGTTTLAQSAGSVTVGIGTTNAKFNVQGDAFQMSLRNTDGGLNEWFIGVSDNSWIAGDDQLIFSPAQSSADAVLRLMNIADNDGNFAPVMIHSNNDHTLLIDGNEIDVRNGALFLNHNSNHDTYINANGGRVAIGTDDPHGVLHINTSGTALNLQEEGDKWSIGPMENGDISVFFGFFPAGYVSLSDGGQWIPVSDKRMKENIHPMGSTMDKINRIGLYSYHFRSDTTGRSDIGVIAQDIEGLFPEVVHVVEGRYGVSYDQLAAVAIKGIQEQQADIDALMSEVDDLLAEYGVD